VRVGIRPEDLRFALDSSVTGNVTIIKEMGDENYLYARMADVAITACIDNAVNPDEGSIVELAFDESDFYLFDAETNTALILSDGAVPRIRFGYQSSVR